MAKKNKSKHVKFASKPQNTQPQQAQYATPSSQQTMQANAPVKAGLEIGEQFIRADIVRILILLAVIALVIIALTIVNMRTNFPLEFGASMARFFKLL